MEHCFTVCEALLNIAHRTYVHMRVKHFLTKCEALLDYM